MRRQFFDLEPGESLSIDGPARVTAQSKTGKRLRVMVESDAHTSKTREDMPHPASSPPPFLPRPKA